MPSLGRLSFAIAFAILPLSNGLAEEPNATSTKPNIVFILADDLGYGDLGCYGQSTLATPNIDRMAAEGLRFTQHYTGSTVCAPSRCSLLTGLHMGHCRVRGNEQVVMRDEDVMLPQLLKRAGYTCACIGKWGVGRPPRLDDPNRMGFDYFYGYTSMVHAHNCFPEFLVRNGEKVPLRNVVPEKWADGEGQGVATVKVDFAPELITREALRFIDQNHERPFFLYYALNIPHANNEGGNNGMEVPSFGPFADRPWPDTEKGFAAMIRQIDGDVARVLDKLREYGIDDQTIVFFASDNGPHQEGGHLAEYFDSNGPLRGIKRDMYDGGVRTPLIAYWPGVIAPGESDHVSAFWDILPTLCDLAGAATPSNLDGISFAPTLLGHADQQQRHTYLYWEFKEQGGKQAVRLENWKGVRLHTQKSPDGPIELYRLTDDVSETSNVAAAHPDVVARIEAIMKEAHTPEE